MNSLTLKEKGFSNFVPLKTLDFSSLPYNKGSIIIIADSTLTDKPTSDILYIGRTKKPTKRVYAGYLGGVGGKTTRKINAHLLNDGYLDKATLSYLQTDNPKATKKELLENFKKEHGVYPAWNAAKKSAAPNKTASKAKVAVRARPRRRVAKAEP